ncbi:MAG: ectoine hydroxylase-related dioxygenase (phytanoyl-CoA dioxygenase family) [Chlamydiales bacterium]|jgi:ectoine hydroxylase-related dioxygenase (phytanoyl-CoA dioxygenase family)
MMDLEEYKHLMDVKGWVVLDSVIEKSLIKQMAQDIHIAYENCRAIQIRNGIPQNNAFTVHHLIGQCDSFLNYLQRSEVLDEYLKASFGGKYILNSFGGAINTANSSSYAHNIHRDVRTYSSELPLLLNTLVMLDDFTEENGATYMMSASHKTHPEAPRRDEFEAVAERALGKAGSILIFNSNVWHAGGDNKTENARRSVTPMYCQPYVKPQFDYPRVLGYNRKEEFSGYLCQVLGYNARIPETLEEWYQPVEKRMYQSSQG